MIFVNLSRQNWLMAAIVHICQTWHPWKSGTIDWMKWEMWLGNNRRQSFRLISKIAKCCGVGAVGGPLAYVFSGWISRPTNCQIRIKSMNWKPLSRKWFRAKVTCYSADIKASLELGFPFRHKVNDAWPLSALAGLKKASLATKMYIADASDAEANIFTREKWSDYIIISAVMSGRKRKNEKFMWHIKWLYIDLPCGSMAARTVRSVLGQTWKISNKKQYNRKIIMKQIYWMMVCVLAAASSH